MDLGAPSARCVLSLSMRFRVLPESNPTNGSAVLVYRNSDSMESAQCFLGDPKLYPPKPCERAFTNPGGY